MKAKLHKMESGYILSLNGDIDDPYAIVNKELAQDYEWYKLSLKNCQAIEFGYDLDALAEKEFPLLKLTNHSSDIYTEEENLQLLGHRKTYIKAFQKALEIFGDKKFNEDHMKRIYEKGYSAGRNELNSRESDKIKYDYIQSLQQTEWDIEIYTLNDCQGDFEKCNKENFNCVLCTDTGIPKLDENGCLILKTFKP